MDEDSTVPAVVSKNLRILKIYRISRYAIIITKSNLRQIKTQDIVVLAILIAMDDEPKAIKVIEHHVSKIENLELISRFYNADDAFFFLKQNPIDLVFLDINMPHKSGLELLNELQHQPLIIFTTAYAEFAIDSYTYNAVDYLLKPFEFDRFQTAIDKAEKRISSEKQQRAFFFIKDGFKNIKFQFEDILFVKCSGNYLDIHIKGKAFTPRLTLTALIKKVPASQFMRVHQSYLINIAHIHKIENNQIYISHHQIPISSRYKELIFKRLGLN